jgi:hypothetical protein
LERLHPNKDQKPEGCVTSDSSIEMSSALRLREVLDMGVNSGERGESGFEEEEEEEEDEEEEDDDDDEEEEEDDDEEEEEEDEDKNELKGDGAQDSTAIEDLKVVGDVAVVETDDEGKSLPLTSLESFLSRLLFESSEPWKTKESELPRLFITSSTFPRINHLTISRSLGQLAACLSAKRVVSARLLLSTNRDIKGTQASASSEKPNWSPMRKSSTDSAQLLIFSGI